jgi:hypothetical protein
MISSDLRKRWRFFMANAGHVAPPGKVVCALELARAEIEAKRRWFNDDWEFVWEEDDIDIRDITDEPEAFYRELHEVMCCILKDRSGKVLASLSGIIDADRDYQRVVEAELASEALA